MSKTTRVTGPLAVAFGAVMLTSCASGDKTNNVVDEVADVIPFGNTAVGLTRNISKKGPRDYADGFGPMYAMDTTDPVNASRVLEAVRLLHEAGCEHRNGQVIPGNVDSWNKNRWGVKETRAYKDWVEANPEYAPYVQSLSRASLGLLRQSVEDNNTMEHALRYGRPDVKLNTCSEDPTVIFK